MNEVTRKIAREISANGSISFARFMELALYCPVYGFYEKEKDTVGRRGDFYTSVSVGPLFGELLAAQFAQWLEDVNASAPRDGKPVKVQLVEAGAHDGRMAKDILGWLRSRRRELFDRLEYWVVEPSPRRQTAQQGALRDFSERTRWVENLVALPPIQGVIFSNELLDAMPILRLGWDAQRREWFEFRVTLEGDGFAWVRSYGILHPASPSADAETLLQPDPLDLELAMPDLPENLLAVLPDGYTLETSPAARSWWLAAAKSLERGKLLAIDYGLTEEELLIPERKDGTLRAYRAHQVSRDVLAHPGDRDLTAHVNFTTLRRAGESNGLRTLAYLTQGQFLTQVAVPMWNQPEAFGEWTGARTRQFQTLTHPEHLGQLFRVLVQER